jgi:hypothetical protein
MGQGYDDIISFDSNKFIESLFESGGQVGVSVEEVTSMQTISEIAVEKVKSADPQTIREEEKDIVLLSKPPVNISSPTDGITLQEHQQAVKELAPKPSVHKPEPSEVKEQPKEKKSRFGFFGKKRTNEDRSKEEAEEVDKKEKYQLEEKRAGEQQEEEKEQKENERARLKEEEKHRSDKERNLREDKDTKEQEENKVVYLTDEDIEDLLK